MTYSGCSALHRVNPNFKKRRSRQISKSRSASSSKNDQLNGSHLKKEGLLKHTSSNMIRKIFRLKSGHNLLPARKSKYDLATPSSCVTCEMPFNEHHLLFEGKNLQLLQHILKTMITNILFFH